jgi:uncharacterized membrane protein
MGTAISTPTETPPRPLSSGEAGGDDRPRLEEDRIASVDIIRGAVMVLMAIDHVRVYAGVPPGGPTPGLFFTRWVTHFCAPAFVFLAGTAAFLHGRRIARWPSGQVGASSSAHALSRFLVMRGLWLIVLEMTVIRLSWTFNFDFANYLLAGVIWAIGWSMIVLAGLVRLPIAVTGAIGVLMIAGHNAWSALAGAQQLAEGSAGWFWKILYFGGAVSTWGDGGPPLIVLYSLIPWIGVMAAGYAFGHILTLERVQRNRWCYAIGVGVILLFLVLRLWEGYGDRPWRPMTNDGMPAVLAFLSTSKYPASFLFLLMTLGPTVVLIPLLERARGRVARWLTVFGRVPMFYYLLHIPLIHAIAVAVAAIRTPANLDWLFENHPMGMSPPPDGYPWSLGLLYLVTVAAVVALYFPCRWYMRVKKEKQNHPWLSYL